MTPMGTLELVRSGDSVIGPRVAIIGGTLLVVPAVKFVFD